MSSCPKITGQGRRSSADWCWTYNDPRTNQFDWSSQYSFSRILPSSLWSPGSWIRSPARSTSSSAIQAYPAQISPVSIFSSSYSYGYWSSPQSHRPTKSFKWFTLSSVWSVHPLWRSLVWRSALATVWLALVGLHLFERASKPLTDCSPQCTIQCGH